MNPHSIVRFPDAGGHDVGMGTVVSKRCVATLGHVVCRALGIASNSREMPKDPVSFYLPLSSSKSVISSHAVSWAPIASSADDDRPFIIVVLEVSPDDEDILSPAPLISARETDFYFDRRFRMLANAPDIGDVYVTGVLEGILPNGLVQMQLSVDSKRAIGSGGSAVWDIETGCVLGIYCASVMGDRMGFMAPTQAIANARPNLDVGFVAPERVRARMKSKPKIFICHANEESAVAAEIYDRLEGSGYDPWLDKKSLLPGQKWDYEIRAAVKSAEFFVVLLSQNSVQKKGYVQREFKLAMDLLDEIPEGQIYLIPVRIDNCLVPSQFAAFQWVDLQGPGGYDQLRKAVEFQLSSAARQSSGTKG